MSAVVNKEKCNGCPGLSEPRCVQSCPGDLMAIDPAAEKAYIRDARDCWDCFCCIKACPRGAIHCRLPFQLADFGASLQPKVGKDTIKWISASPDGRQEEFVLPTRRA